MFPLHEHFASAGLMCSLPLPLPMIAPQLQLCSLRLPACKALPLLCLRESCSSQGQLTAYLLREDLQFQWSLLYLEFLNSCSLEPLLGDCRILPCSYYLFHVYMFIRLEAPRGQGPCLLFLCVPNSEESFNKQFKIGGSQCSKSTYFSLLVKEMG